MDSFRRDALAGAAAGLIAGLVFAWVLQAHGMAGHVSGLLGLPLTGAGLAGHLVLAVVIGAGFGALFRYEAEGYAATISSGVLYGLLWWIAGPLTLSPVFEGRIPAWSLAEAGAAFPSLVGHLFYGGLTGLSFYFLVSLYLRSRPAGQEVARQAQPSARHVVVLGGGFAGVSAAQRLEELFRRDPTVEITLVSQSNHLLFTPMLAEVASSGLEAQHISAPVRAALTRTKFRRAEVETIDTVARTVHIHAGRHAPVEILPYDHLILALGSVPNFFNLPGLEANAFRLKTLGDATALRNHVIAALERADLEPDPTERRHDLTFVVAGGGFAGTEMIAELFDLARSVLRYYPHIQPEDLRFALVHSGERVLPELSAELGDYARCKLEARGIEFLLRTRVMGATADAVLLSGDRQVPTHTLVWTAGNQPNPLLAGLPCEHTRTGAVVADSTLQVKGLPNVWAVGDCAQIPDPDHPDTFYPPTAQHALREGKVVAENVAATLRGRPVKPLRFRTIGMLVVLGRRTAAAEIRGRKFSGLLAWLMWRTIYLSKLPGLEKKVRVAFDWTIDLFFPRDIVLTAGEGPATGPVAFTGHTPAEVVPAVRTGANHGAPSPVEGSIP